MAALSSERSRRIRKQLAKSGLAPLKVCGKCRELLPRAEFNAAVKNIDGLCYTCRQCRRANKKEWHESHKALQNSASREYYRAHPEDAARRAREWERTHPEWAKERDRRYKAEHEEELHKKRTSPERRERSRQNAAQWRVDNPERSKERCRRQQAVRWYAAKANPVSYDDVYKRDNGVCYLCEEPVARKGCHFDHVIPLFRGGEHTYENIRPTHPSCNYRKGYKLVQPGAYAVRKDGEHSG